jgi:usherin
VLNNNQSINLSVSGTHKVEVRWEEPDQLNGVLQRYILYASMFPITLGHVVYNNSDFFTDYVIQDLLAGTVYYITLSVSS